MRLAEYIRLVDGSMQAFSERSGVLVSTLDRIARGEVRCRIDIANAIVKASHERPTASGGVVTFEELIPTKKTSAA
jgi:hypothetical protein